MAAKADKVRRQCAKALAPVEVTGQDIGAARLKPEALALKLRPVRKERNKKVYNRRAAW